MTEVLTLIVRRRNLFWGLVALLVLGGLIYFCWQQTSVVQALFMEEKAKLALETNPEENQIVSEKGLNGGEVALVSPELFPVSSPRILEPENNSAFFAEFRIERDRLRSQQVEFCREIINNPGSTSEMRQEAQKQLFSLSQDMEKELKVENLLLAQGYPEAVVFLQPQAVTLVLGGTSPYTTQLTSVTSMVSRTLGCKEELVTVITRP